MSMPDDDQHTLKLFKVRSEDMGHMTFVVSNKHGNDSCTFGVEMAGRKWLCQPIHSPAVQLTPQTTDFMSAASCTDIWNYHGRLGRLCWGKPSVCCSCGRQTCSGHPLVQGWVLIVCFFFHCIIFKIVRVNLKKNKKNQTLTKVCALCFQSDILLAESSHYTFVYDDNECSLVVLNASSGDSGVYTCTARNLAGSVSCKAELTVHEGKKFLKRRMLKLFTLFYCKHDHLLQL